MLTRTLGYSMTDPKSWRLNKAFGGGGAIMDFLILFINRFDSFFIENTEGGRFF